MKSEPNEYGIADLAKDKTACWDGVRNYQVRNMMRDQMKIGDPAFFYHSNCTEPGIVGTMTICKAAYPDFTAFDPQDKHYDSKSDPNNPRWWMIDVKYQHAFKHTITLSELRQVPALKDMLILRRGNRLSITPVTLSEWACILGLE